MRRQLQATVKNKNANPNIRKRNNLQLIKRFLLNLPFFAEEKEHQAERLGRILEIQKMQKTLPCLLN